MARRPPPLRLPPRLPDRRPDPRPHRGRRHHARLRPVHPPAARHPRHRQRSQRAGPAHPRRQALERPHHRDHAQQPGLPRRNQLPRDHRLQRPRRDHRPGSLDLAQRILTERGETIGRRAANPSDYDLTGLIICPRCGHKYIGTNATGRTRTYRYYTCFSRQRYGTKAGCDAHPFNADTLDAAIREALIDFYTTGDDLIAQAIAEFQQVHQDSHADLRREQAGVEKDLAKTQAAIDRYLTAFEAGTMDPDICQPRLAELAERAKQLRTRAAELAADLDHPPAAPSPVELRQVREYIRDILAHGTAQERKSLYEALIDHIEITSDDTIVPVYRVPMTNGPDGPAPDRPKTAGTGANDAVRALVSTVGRAGLEPATEGL
jgi:site-specific DNA recombinase